jgi:hypothetical protein
MFVLNDDLSIEVNRGDIVFFSVMAVDGEFTYEFQPGDIVRMAIYGRKDAENCVMQKDFPVIEATDNVFIHLEEEDTKIGEIISKPKDYWYEIVLNPDTAPQTIIGYDEDGAKIFKLYPESSELHEDEPTVEDIPVVDDELDMTSNRPIENQAVARAIVELDETYKKAVANLNVEVENLKAIVQANKEAYEAKDSTHDFRLNDIAESLISEVARLDLLIEGLTNEIRGV